MPVWDARKDWTCTLVLKITDFVPWLFLWFGMDRTLELFLTTLTPFFTERACKFDSALYLDGPIEIYLGRWNIFANELSAVVLVPGSYSCACPIHTCSQKKKTKGSMPNYKCDEFVVSS